ncbi:hypothetical protein DXG01_000041 [Tephrocybe rancida]|nr:hypothetical protein DXG01_000041 [Tephrocybe rancida]
MDTRKTTLQGFAVGRRKHFPKHQAIGEMLPTSENGTPLQPFYTGKTPWEKLKGARKPEFHYIVNAKGGPPKKTEFYKKRWANQSYTQHEVIWRIGQCWYYLGTYHCSFIDVLDTTDLAAMPWKVKNDLSFVTSNYNKQVKDDLDIPSLYRTGELKALRLACRRVDFNEEYNRALFQAPSEAPRASLPDNRSKDSRSQDIVRKSEESIAASVVPFQDNDTPRAPPPPKQPKAETKPKSQTQTSFKLRFKNLPSSSRARPVSKPGNGNFAYSGTIPWKPRYPKENTYAAKMKGRAHRARQERHAHVHALKWQKKRPARYAPPALGGVSGSMLGSDAMDAWVGEVQEQTLRRAQGGGGPKFGTGRLKHARLPEWDVEEYA